MYSLSPLSVNARGGKTATLLCGNDRVTTYLPLEIIFPPCNFDRDETAVRQNITARVTSCVDTFFSELDDWAIPYISAHSERLLGKKLTEDEVRFAYTSSIKRPEGKDPMLKIKINMPTSKCPCKCWSQEGEKIPWIEDWAGATIKSKILVSHLWVMGSGQKCEMGLVCVLTDAMPTAPACAFPF